MHFLTGSAAPFASLDAGTAHTCLRGPIAIGGFGRGLLLLLLANFERLAAPAAGVSKHTRPHRNPPWLLLATPHLQTMLVRPAKCPGEGTMEDCGVGGGYRTESQEVAHSQSLQQTKAGPGPMARKLGLGFGFKPARLRPLRQRTAMPGQSVARPRGVVAKPIRPVDLPPCHARGLQKAWRTESVRWEEHA